MDDSDLLTQPIGFWVKRVDEVLTEHVNDLLADQGLTRFHWMVLNQVHEAEGGLARDRLFGFLLAFTDSELIEEIVSDFVSRGWVSVAGDRFTVTAPGRTAHQELFAQINGVRAQSLAGIADADYIQAIRTLRRMVANLGAAIDSPSDHQQPTA